MEEALKRIMTNYLQALLAVRKLEIEEIDKRLSSEASIEVPVSELRRRAVLCADCARIAAELDFLSRSYEEQQRAN